MRRGRHADPRVRRSAHTPNAPRAPKRIGFRQVSYKTIRYELADNGVATLSLNQPETRNALSNELLGELEAALLQARDDPDARCVVLASTHERVFSSGASLSGFAEQETLVR